MFNYHFESNAIVRSPVNQAFAYIDDHTRLSSHMSESSWKMGGGQMEFVLDEGRGQKIGSQIRLVGRVFGIELSVDVLKRKVPGTMSQRLAGAGSSGLSGLSGLFGSGNERHNDRSRSPASDDRSARSRWKQHGRPCTRWEVARVWRLGRRKCLSCADPEDPCEGWG